MPAALLEMRGISKRFPGVLALDGVSFDLHAGEIHALVGENGAGKSTLMNIVGGVYPYGTYDGDILVDGQVQRFPGVRPSEDAGIAVVHQELSLIPDLTVEQNIWFRREALSPLGTVRARALRAQTLDLFERYAFPIARPDQ